MFSNSKTYFSKLIEEVYVQGQDLLTDFTIKEGVFGKVKASIGEIDLEELHLFPKKFAAGQYDISVELDTPKKTVSNYTELMSTMNQLDSKAKACVLDPDYLGLIAEKALDLRFTLGALSRYNVPETNLFSTTTNSYKVVRPDNTTYFFYLPEKKQNVAVSFGKNYLDGIHIEGLAVLDGNQHENALKELIGLGMYAPSEIILDKRINELTALYEQNVKRTKSLDEHSSFKQLIDNIVQSKTSLETVLNHDVRGKYLAELQPELRDFMIFPTTEDILSHELLSRLSWNENIRRYHDTKRFISIFEEDNTPYRIELLNGVVSNLLFNNQQNYDVNNWLYANHKEFCEKNSITFTVL